MLHGVQFKYSVKVPPGSPVVGAFDHVFHKAGEIIINSQRFENYEECNNKLSYLLSTLTIIANSLGKKQYVILTKVNPMTTKEAVDDDEEWSPLIVSKIYVAEAESTKKGKPEYCVMAQTLIDRTLADNLIKNTPASVQ